MAAWLPIAISSLTAAVAVFTFLAGQHELSRRAKVDYVEELESRLSDSNRRLEECEKDRKVLHSKCNDLKDREYKLMRRIEVLEAGTA